ncbi:hypothetical protein CLF_111461 [Clonorchis sinensis]|uniref:Uncharacterized protein n=1 Tax=Clonorchis sinensis TaxID=79923 RepID=H2KV72_CLOSI|nr:hypothetical protein CLF_111461 [Clonorchis sinensis]
MTFSVGAAKRNDWEMNLSRMLLANCVCIRPTTRKFPFMLMYGQHPCLPSWKLVVKELDEVGTYDNTTAVAVAEQFGVEIEECHGPIVNLSVLFVTKYCYVCLIWEDGRLSLMVSDQERLKANGYHTESEDKANNCEPMSDYHLRNRMSKCPDIWQTTHFQLASLSILRHFGPSRWRALWLKSGYKIVTISTITLLQAEKSSTYLRTLQTQAAKCDYGAQLEEQLRDRLIDGIRLPELQQKLLLLPGKSDAENKLDGDMVLIHRANRTSYTDLNLWKRQPKLWQEIKLAKFERKFIGYDDTGSVESIIPQSDQTAFYPNVVIVPRRQSTIGLKVLRSLRNYVSLLKFVNANELKQLVIKCSKATGGMRIPKVKLKAMGDHTFLKRQIIPFDLHEPVRQALNSMCGKGILIPVESSNQAIPIVTPLTADGITPRIFGGYRSTLNTRLLQRTCITEEPEDVAYRLPGLSMFSKMDPKHAYLKIPLNEAFSNLIVINTSFKLFRYNFLPFRPNVSPDVFQQAMNTSTNDLEGVGTYQDDVSARC